MEIKATVQQICEIMAKAVNASTCPGGMASLSYQAGMHYSAGVFKEMMRDRIDWSNDNKLYVDYYEGRMVKLTFEKVGDDRWKISRGYAPEPDYQSWAKTYPTVSALISGIVN